MPILHKTSKDALLTVQQAFPTAGAANDSSSMDLNPGRKPLGLELQFDFPATPNLANGKNLTVTVHDSDDNSSLAAVSTLGAVSQIGPTSGGGVAKQVWFPVPVDTRRYVRAHIVADAVSGDCTAQKLTFSVVF
jgi:hypothetical protein